MSGQIQWTVALVSIGLFTIAILAFAMNFATDNNAAVNLNNDPEISTLFSSTTNNVSSFNENSETTTTSIIKSSISSGGQTTQSAGAFSITPTNFISISNNIMKVGYVKIFGNSGGFGIFITTFLGLIIFITGLLIWKTWAGRNPN